MSKWKNPNHNIIRIHTYNQINACPINKFPYEWCVFCQILKFFWSFNRIHLCTKSTLFTTNGLFRIYIYIYVKWYAKQCDDSRKHMVFINMFASNSSSKSLIELSGNGKERSSDWKRKKNIENWHNHSSNDEEKEKRKNV